MKKLHSAVSLIMALAIICLSFGLTAFAADIKVEKKPDRTSFYEGVDWIYGKNGSIMLTNGDLDLSGTVLSYSNKTVEFSRGKFGANMYTSPVSGSWVAGKNDILIKCDGFDSSARATLSVNFITISSIEIVRAPKTKLVLDTEWKMGIGKDVEMTSLDLTGTVIDVNYIDSAKKRVSYPNALLGWSIEEDVDVVMPGQNTLYITFCGKRAPFAVDFITQKSFEKGDVSLDGAVNSYDALCVLQSSTGLITLSPTQSELADINGDDKINSLDALKILQYVVGSNKTL